MHHFPKYSKRDDDDIDSTEFWRNNAVEPSADAGVVRKTYAPSKLAALLLSLELNRRYGESKGIRSIAVNPGSV
jgi:NAD(P)-dependent dehydrogenase (short-subunit alcohol dehydrogenase family)